MLELETLDPASIDGASCCSCPVCGKTTMPTPVSHTPIPRPLLLVVDDEVPVLKVVERLAVKAGFDVVTCASGAEAMRTLTRKPADLAMVDLRMPDVNGLDLLRQIKVAVPGCEVILMTAFAAVDSAVEAIKLGAREYLSKPVRLRSSSPAPHRRFGSSSSVARRSSRSKAEVARSSNSAG